MAFNVPNWSVRIYDYEPELSGEFRLKSHNGKGITVFTVFNYIILDQSIFHFRASMEKKKLISEFGLQLNIGF